MIDAAMKDFSIDLENSWMIGDKKIDVETGRNGRDKNGDGANWLWVGTFGTTRVRAIDDRR